MDGTDSLHGLLQQVSFVSLGREFCPQMVCKKASFTEGWGEPCTWNSLIAPQNCQLWSWGALMSKIPRNRWDPPQRSCRDIVWGGVVRTSQPRCQIAESTFPSAWAFSFSSMYCPQRMRNS